MTCIIEFNACHDKSLHGATVTKLPDVKPLTPSGKKVNQVAIWYLQYRSVHIHPPFYNLNSSRKCKGAYMQDLTFYLAKTPPLPVLRLDVDIGESSYVRLGLPPLLSSSRNSNTFWSRSTNRGWPRHRCFQALLGFFLSMCCSIDSICANTLAIDGKFLSCSADTGFVLVLPMDHVAMYFGSMAK